MHGDICRAVELLSDISQRETEETFAAIPLQAVPGFGENGKLKKLFAYSDVIEHSDAVRAKMDAGTKSRECGRLLIDINVVPGPLEKNCTGYPSQTCTDDSDPEMVCSTHRVTQGLGNCQLMNISFPMCGNAFD
jgi:hypothetical protein